MGFSIVKYTGNGNASTVGHGLDVAPEMYIVKSLSTGNWWTYHSGLNGGVNPSHYFIRLDLSNAESFNASSGGSIFNSTEPTSTVFSGGTSINTSNDFIAYCFTSKPGFSKVGSYTGNGSTSGPIIQTGFEPAFLMIKTTGADGWFMVDNKRNTSNPRGNRLFANSSVAEASEPGAQVNFYANGFQLTGSGGGQGQTNSNGQTYIYLAIAADGSTATPSLANSFATDIYNGNGSSQNITTTGFKPDFTWIKCRTNTNQHNLFDSVRGAGRLLSSQNTDAQSGNPGNLLGSFNSNGFEVNRNYLSYTAHDNTNNTYPYVAWSWKAGGTPSINTDGTTGNNGNVTAAVTSIVSANQAAGFSIAEFIAPIADGGIGYGAPNYGHGLAGTPDLVIFKRVDSASSWMVFSNGNGLGPRKRLELNNSTNPANTACDIFNAGPTTVGIGGTCFNESPGSKWITYNFQSISGYSKVGSYTGTGALGNVINVGFKPTFLMWKKTNGAVGWFLLDGARNTTDVWSARLEPNNSGAEAGPDSYTVTVSNTGFEMTGSFATWTGSNELNSTYIYLAIKEN